MLKRTAFAAIVGLVVVLLAPVSAAQAAVPGISGPHYVTPRATVTITGTAGANQAVSIWFHKKGQPADYYSARRALTANSAGRYSTTYVADTDYRYYAQTSDGRSGTALTQVYATVISGPPSANKGSTVTISGTVTPPGSAVDIYFHKAGQPAAYYSLRRHLASNAATGAYSTTYVEDADYRYYAVANHVASVGALTQVAPAWLAAINGYRAAYGLPAVYQNAALSAADAKHVYYMDHTGQLGHSENPASPYYTAVGNTAASRSNVAGSTGGAVSDVQWVNIWMDGPFHELGILRPTLASVGYAQGSGPHGRYAALDVLSDVSRPDPGHWPKTFPNSTSTFPFLAYSGGEIPDPVAGCPTAFRTQAVSAPLLVSLGRSAAAIASASARLTDDTAHLARAVCTLTESTYRNSNAGLQSTGRSILAEDHTVAVFAGVPLSRGHRYTLSVTPNGRAAITVHFNT